LLSFVLPGFADGVREAVDLGGERITAPWGVDWAWGLPLIIATVMFHVFGLGLIKRKLEPRTDLLRKHQVFSIGGITLYIALLLGIEAFLWALAFQGLGALPDKRTGMLYSLNALTSFGHIDAKLEPQWQLLGALEALNGSILFGLSAAYLFGLVQRTWWQSASEPEP
jgi:hypothetical protein